MATGTPQEHLQKAAQATKEQARSMMSGATETARSTFEEQKETAAGSIGGFAGALRKAAQESQDGQASRVAEWAAEGLERVSSTLRSKDLDSMVREVQSFARQQPVAFFAAAAALGFVAARFLKAGQGDGATAGLQGGRRQEELPQNFPPPGAGGVSSTELSDISSTSRF